MNQLVGRLDQFHQSGMSALAFVVGSVFPVVHDQF